MDREYSIIWSLSYRIRIENGVDSVYSSDYINEKIGAQSEQGILERKGCRISRSYLPSFTGNHDLVPKIGWINMRSLENETRSYTVRCKIILHTTKMRLALKLKEKSIESTALGKDPAEVKPENLEVLTGYSEENLGQRFLDKRKLMSKDVSVGMSKL